MRVYCYNGETKEFSGVEEAQENPRKKGEYLMPRNSTTIQVNKFSEGFIPVFNGRGWEIVQDLRGKLQIKLEDLSVSKIEYIGKVKDGYQLIDEEILNDFLVNPACYAVVDGVFQCIRGTEQYAKTLEAGFEKEFIETNLGYVRINTAWGNFLAIKPNYDNVVAAAGYLPENSLILYNKPGSFKNFKDSLELNQWLVENGQFYNKKVNAEDYALFSKMILSRFQKDISGGV